MVERICPACQHANPIDDRFCGQCGAALERLLPARRAQTGLTLAGRSIPVHWQQVGKTVALGVAAVAAEVGMAWLRQKMDRPATTTTALAPRPAATAPKAADPSALAQATGGVVTIVRQRVIDIIQQGDGHQRIIEQIFWQKREE